MSFISNELLESFEKFAKDDADFHGLEYIVETNFIERSFCVEILNSFKNDDEEEMCKLVRGGYNDEPMAHIVGSFSFLLIFMKLKSEPDFPYKKRVMNDCLIHLVSELKSLILSIEKMDEAVLEKEIRYMKMLITTHFFLSWISNYLYVENIKFDKKETDNRDEIDEFENQKKNFTMLEKAFNEWFNQKEEGENEGKKNKKSRVSIDFVNQLLSSLKTKSPITKAKEKTKKITKKTDVIEID